MSEPAEAAAPRELIAFQIGAQEFCVDIMAVREIRGWTPATPLPQAPSYVRGVVNLRGAVLPIIDLGARLGLGAAEPKARSVVIVVSIQGQLVGLLVDAVCDILNAAEGALQAAPDVAGEGMGAFVKTLLTIEDRMLGVVSLDNVLPPREAEAA
jgi:purine-binding chemotaxis protein CheW